MQLYNFCTEDIPALSSVQKIISLSLGISALNKTISIKLRKEIDGKKICRKYVIFSKVYVLSKQVWFWVYFINTVNRLEIFPVRVRLLQQRAGREASLQMMQCCRQGGTEYTWTLRGVRKYILFIPRVSSTPVSPQSRCLSTPGVSFLRGFPSISTVKGRVSRIDLFVTDSPEVREHSLLLAGRPEWEPYSNVLLIGFMYHHFDYTCIIYQSIIKILT